MLKFKRFVLVLCFLLFNSSILALKCRLKKVLRLSHTGRTQIVQFFLVLHVYSISLQNREPHTLRRRTEGQ